MDDRNLSTIKDLFKGRHDVFAISWEKGTKAGYMPAYIYDPYQYRLHKSNGGTFSNFPDKTYKPLTNDELVKHLNGNQFIGIYPLLIDNTSWFLVADFDKKDWKEQCLSFIEACHSNGIPAYLERSRSGNGGHVWIFFEENLQATKTRKLFINILQKCGAFSVFDKGSSFDRIFPNQDYLSGKGLGNLIALPLNGMALKNGNSCFISTESFAPFDDQYTFLQSVQRLSTIKFNSLYKGISNSSELSEELLLPSSSETLTIQLSNQLSFNSMGVTAPIINFLTDKLNFANPEFFIKKKQNRSTYKTERYYNFIEEHDDIISIPKGMTGSFLKFCKQASIGYDFRDKRNKLPTINYDCNIELRSHQKDALASISKKDFGVIVAPPGSGKTVIGLKLISDRKQPALIIVHRKQLMEQWFERIESFLGIPYHEIGKIGQGKVQPGKQITVAMIQSLSKQLDKESQLCHAFGTTIIDECHHIPAKSFRNTIGKLNSHFLYGLTATPFRKYNEGKLIVIHLGDVICEIEPEHIENHKHAQVIVRNTDFNVPYNPKTDPFETISQILIHDLARNNLIIKDIIKELSDGNRAVILTERKDHIITLNQLLKHRFETVCLSGDDSQKDRVNKSNLLKAGNFQALITTGQFFGEGSDLQNVSRLFLVYPFSFKGKLIQYMGRVQRSEHTPVIYDYRDYKVDYLNKLFLKRNTYYRKLKKQHTLFNNTHKEEEKPSTYSIRKQIKLEFKELEFRYGIIAFNYVNRQTGELIEFEVENDIIRPEFTILKPYFAKQLGLKKVTLDIYAEFENDILIAQEVQSSDIERINDELIESVKFRFVQKEIIGGKLHDFQEEMLGLKEITKNLLTDIDEEDFINELLSNQDVKHDKQIRFLLKRHQAHILKIRFVLNPFAFVFLIEGEEQYHIVLETLDTEEATYLWHIDKNNLHDQLKTINNDLSILRNKGRQFFIHNAPTNFSRIVHDYSEGNKGYMMWKSMLEEKLI
ncbi:MULTISPECIES: TOTE conflict system archaeo-eukaryotic primase domain-containing protein [unclassified Carboxylicivirga]|uniref:TOTE conflict system archaeo-eukaryotic primase domain-containing protein n=1 Tax=Carboxylicivirga TaxID=1628153 RepID=UPI003D33D5DC